MLGLVLFVIVAVVFSASLLHIVRDHRRFDDVTSARDWSELTNGKLRKGRQGPLLTFYASGRTSAGDSKTTAPDIFVAVDEGALVVVQVQPWPRPPQVAWLERSVHGPLLRVRSGYWGRRSPRSGRASSWSVMAEQRRRRRRICAAAVGLWTAHPHFAICRRRRSTLTRRLLLADRVTEPVDDGRSARRFAATALANRVGMSQRRWPCPGTCPVSDRSAWRCPTEAVSIIKAVSW